MRKSLLCAFTHTQNEEDIKQGSTNHNNFLVMNFICRHSIKNLKTKTRQVSIHVLPSVATDNRAQFQCFNDPQFTVPLFLKFH